MHLRLALIAPLFIAAFRACGAPAPIAQTQAEALRSSVGVNLHLEYDGTPYRDPERVIAALRFLGVSDARDAAIRSGDRRLDRFAAVARAGIRYDLFVSQDIAEQLARLERLSAEAPRALSSIEGPNEANHEAFGAGAAGEPGRLQAYQARLYREVHASSRLGSLPVVSFTYWPPLGGRADIANFHAYPSLSKPIPPQLAWQRRLASAVQPLGSPIVCTETGFTTGGAEATSEARQAELEPILLLENFRASVRRTYLYELFDEADPAGAAGGDRENHWGLFGFDGRPKPAALAVRRFMTLLRATNSGGRSQPAAWVTLSGDARLRTLRVERPDGVRLTFMWWTDADAGPQRRLASSSPSAIEVLDLATGQTQHLRAGRGEVLAGSAPLAFVQSPVATRDE